MKNVKSYEVAEHFGIPKPTMANWSKERNSWRNRLYKKLCNLMVREKYEESENND